MIAPGQKNARGLGAPGQMTLEKMKASDHRIPWRRAAGTAGRPSHKICPGVQHSTTHARILSKMLLLKHDLRLLS